MGIASTFTAALSPSRITEPAPNSCSIWRDRGLQRRVPGLCVLCRYVLQRSSSWCVCHLFPHLTAASRAAQLVPAARIRRRRTGQRTVKSDPDATERLRAGTPARRPAARHPRRPPRSAPLGTHPRHRHVRPERPLLRLDQPLLLPAFTSPACSAAACGDSASRANRRGAARRCRRAGEAQPRRRAPQPAQQARERLHLLLRPATREKRASRAGPPVHRPQRGVGERMVSPGTIPRRTSAGRSRATKRRRRLPLEVSVQPKLHRRHETTPRLHRMLRMPL